MVRLKLGELYPPDVRADVEPNRAEVSAQIGNAVPCQLARVLALALGAQVFGAELPFRVATLGDGDRLGFRARKRTLTRVYERRAAARRRGVCDQPEPRANPGPRAYRARWGAGFELAEDPVATTGLWVRARLTSGCLRVGVSRGKAAGRPAFRVVLTPSGGTS